MEKDVAAPLVSVIVPAYNSETSIERCIRSLINQTYNPLEIIIVNDGSTDSTIDISRKYEEEYINLSVISQNNGGVSSARNKGLANSKGDWVTFVDSDDWVESDYIFRLCSHIEQDIDFAICNIVSREGRPIYNESLHATIITDNALNWLIHEIRIFSNTGPVAKLFKREYISDNKIEFPLNISFGEDAVFVLQYLQYVKSAGYEPFAGYHYCNVSSESLSQRIISQSELCKSIDMFLELASVLCKKSNSMDYLPIVQTQEAKILINNYLRNNEEIRRESKQITLDTFKRMKELKLFSILYWARFFIEILPIKTFYCLAAVFRKYS